MISAGQKVNKLMQDFFTAYFNERDYKAAAGFLREDIRDRPGGSLQCQRSQ